MTASSWKKYRNRKRRIARLKSELEQMGPLIRPGVYRITPHVLYRHEDDEARFLQSRGWSKPLKGATEEQGVRAWSHQLRAFCRFHEVKDKPGANGNDKPGALQQSQDLAGFKGSILFVGRRKTVVLDPQDDQVLMAYRGERAYNAHSHRPRELLEHFPAPPILASDDERRMVVERLGKGRYREQWTPREREDAVAYLGRQTNAYLNKVRQTDHPLRHGTKTAREILDQLQGLSGLGPLAALLRSRFNLDRLGDTPFPLVHTHGDLKLENLLHQDGSFLALDWEFCRPHLFFFDLVHWVFREARYHDNFEPMGRYLAGAMDRPVAAAFDTMDCTWNPDHREAYLGLYLAEWLVDRGLERTPESRMKQNAFYHRFLDRSEVRGLLEADQGPGVQRVVATSRSAAR